MFPAVLYSTKHKTINGKCPFLPLLGTDVCQNVWCMNRSLFGKLSHSFIHSIKKINIYCNYVLPKSLNLLLYGLIGLSWLHVYNIAYWNMSWDIIWKKDNVGRCVPLAPPCFDDVGKNFRIIRKMHWLFEYASCIRYGTL